MAMEEDLVATEEDPAATVVGMAVMAAIMEDTGIATEAAITADIMAIMAAITDITEAITGGVIHGMEAWASRSADRGTTAGRITIPTITPLIMLLITVLPLNMLHRPT